jgi:hypothetical protein
MNRVGLAVLLAFVALFQTACCCCDIWFNNFARFQCRSKQSEAKVNLKSLYVAQESYRAEFDKYGTLEEIRFVPQGEKIRYEYVLVSYDETHFVAEARGKDEQAGDLWRIDETNKLDNVESICPSSGDDDPAQPEQKPSGPSEQSGIQEARYRY